MTPAAHSFDDLHDVEVEVLLAPDAKARLLHVADRVSVEIGPEPARDRRHEVEKDADRSDPTPRVQGAPQSDMMCVGTRSKEV